MNSRQLRISFCLFLAILLTQGVSSAQSGGFDLDQILGVPFPSGMSAAPTGGAVAWISVRITRSEPARSACAVHWAPGGGMSDGSSCWKR